MKGEKERQKVKAQLYYIQGASLPWHHNKNHQRVIVAHIPRKSQNSMSYIDVRNLKQLNHA